MNELLGSRIKALRSANNFTQEQVANQIGISRQNMQELRVELTVLHWISFLKLQRFLVLQ